MRDHTVRCSREVLRKLGVVLNGQHFVVRVEIHIRGQFAHDKELQPEEEEEERVEWATLENKPFKNTSVELQRRRTVSKAYELAE